MGKYIDDQLSTLKGQAEADLEKTSKQIASLQASIVRLQADKAAKEAEIAEFTTDFPAVVSKPVSTGGVKKVTP
jgi:hypothetical protein